MQIFVPRRIKALLLILLSKAALGNPIKPDCGLLIRLPSSVQLIHDPETKPPLCQLLQAKSLQTPFANRITIVPWYFFGDKNKLDSEQNMGFFKIITKKKIKYLGRRSYTDSRTGYTQTLLDKPLLDTRIIGVNKTVRANSKLRVTWLRSFGESTQEEVTEQFDCVDAAISQSSGLVLLNWCATKGALEFSQINKLVYRISLLPQ
jgi:hypothetical protein